MKKSNNFFKVLVLILSFLMFLGSPLPVFAELKENKLRATGGEGEATAGVKTKTESSGSGSSETTTPGKPSSPGKLEERIPKPVTQIITIGGSKYKLTYDPRVTYIEVEPMPETPSKAPTKKSDTTSWLDLKIGEKTKKVRLLAGLNATPNPVSLGNQVINFATSSSEQVGGSKEIQILSIVDKKWEWSFGDGQTAITYNPWTSHAYHFQSPGQITASVVIHGTVTVGWQDQTASADYTRRANVTIQVTSPYSSAPPPPSTPANLHGSLTIRKSPRYIFVQHHKLQSGDPCHMDVTVSWSNLRYEDVIQHREIRQAWLPTGEVVDWLHTWDEPIMRPANVTGVDIYHNLNRYENKGTDKIRPERRYRVDGGSSGQADFRFEYNNPGDETSTLVVVVHTTEGDIGLNANIPVNAYKGINVDPILAESKELPGWKASERDEWTINF